MTNWWMFCVLRPWPIALLPTAKRFSREGFVLSADLVEQLLSIKATLCFLSLTTSHLHHEDRVRSYSGAVMLGI